MLSASVSKMSGTFQDEIPSVFRTSTYNNANIQGSLLAAGPTKLTLKLLSSGEEYPLRSLTLPANIGRSVDKMRPSARNGLFHSPYLSRHHAAIKAERGKVVVEDLGSSNGTFVNGMSLKAGEPWPLSDGDLVQFGSEDENADSTRQSCLWWYLRLTLDAAIVAQVFFHNLAPALDRPFLSNSQEINGEEDPFNGPAPFNMFPTIPAFAHLAMKESTGSEAIATKIASISRSLASLGVSIRTAPSSSSSLKSTDGTLQILNSIEFLVQDLSRHFGSASLSSVGERIDSPTIHQRPSLPEAMNIIVALFVG